MTSRTKRNLRLTAKWALYLVILLVALTGQTTPGFLTIGQVRPIFILPVCLAVAVYEGEYAGAFSARWAACCGIMPPAGWPGCWPWG